MMVELKEYQVHALEAFSRWRAALNDARQTARQAADVLRSAGLEVPASVHDWPRHAWRQLAEANAVAATAGEYVSRLDDAGRPVPHACLKVPTGGGKTLLAAAALERLGRQTGLTLWIIPTRAIYHQTKGALKNRKHPYRQMLERASGGRVRLLEKDDSFTASDVTSYLCVMLLMLPAANRQNGREFLRLFRDSGRYPTFFPDSDDSFSDRRLLDEHSDLDRISPAGPVKHSLFNVFKMLRPVVVLDEAHKAYGKQRKSGEKFAHSVSRLNPRLVIELSATPNPGVSNLLVDISGIELKAEEMIKLPIQIDTFSNTGWQDTLFHASEELARLDAEATSLQKREGRYIRPIAVVRVERTGKDQQDGERVHAEDVRKYLIQNLGVGPHAVAVKSAEQDELTGVDLLSKYCQVRWVVTKAALMEGWDCPFAYMLVMLDNTRAMRAITQLVGRVMRQPHARRTHSDALDRCYVYCWNTTVGDAVEHVKAGLETEGLTGIDGEIHSTSDTSMTAVTVERRAQFRSQDIFLPLVLHREGDKWRELDYTRDILPNIDWSSIKVTEIGASSAKPAAWRSAAVDIGDERPTFYAERDFFVDKTIKASWFGRRLSDLVPNSWQAARIGQGTIDRLREAGYTDETIYNRRSYVLHELRKHVNDEIEKYAEVVFTEKLRQKEIRFDLDSGRHHFVMAESYEIRLPESAHHMIREDHHSLQLSLFEPVFAHQFDSELERGFARYLDEQRALQWWHRIAARQGGEYYLRGWKQDRIWPDFVAVGGDDDGGRYLLIYETKGAHLDGSDTEYKKRVLEALEDAFECGSMTVREGPAKGIFKLIFSEEEFPSALAGLETRGPSQQ